MEEDGKPLPAAPATSSGYAKPLEPVVDDDGFTSVVKGRQKLR